MVALSFACGSYYGLACGSHMQEFSMGFDTVSYFFHRTTRTRSIKASGAAPSENRSPFHPKTTLCHLRTT